MEAPKSPFKKKQALNFYENDKMNPSLRPLSSSIIQDEKFLGMEKELKKLKKAHHELIEQYDKMKNLSIAEKVAIQMELHQSNQKLKNLIEENNMLKSKIRHLEKESQTRTKSYQRPLDRSINNSVYSIRKSSYQNDDKLSNKGLRLNTESCSHKQSEPKKQLKTSRSNVEESFSYEIIQSRFTQNDESSHKIKFNPQSRKQKPLISEEHQEEDYCCKQRCIQNYSQLQQLRNVVEKYGEEMDQIYMQLKFVLDKKVGLQNVAQYKLEMLQLWQQTTGDDFFYKTRPEKLMKKIEERVQEIVNNPKQNPKSPLFQKIKSKINKIIKNKEELEKEWVSESFDEEAASMELERIKKSQKELLEKFKETSSLKRQKENSGHLTNKQKRNE